MSGKGRVYKEWVATLGQTIPVIGAILFIGIIIWVNTLETWPSDQASMIFGIVFIISFVFISVGASLETYVRCYKHQENDRRQTVAARVRGEFMGRMEKQSPDNKYHLFDNDGDEVAVIDDWYGAANKLEELIIKHKKKWRQR